MNTTTLAERLRSARLAKDVSQADISRAVGMKQPSYNAIESGKTQKSRFLTDIAQYLNIDPIWLATGQGEMTASKTESNARFSDAEIAFWSKGDDVPDGMVAIDFLPEVRGKMGNGYINGDYHEVEQLWFREATLYECNVNSTHAKAIHVAGDSMFPELIDGQAIAIDTSARRIFDGEIYAFRVGDELKVKYLFKHGDGFRAVSRNDDKLRYPDEVYTAKQIESDNIEIIGQFWWKSETRRVRR